jgi:glycosyltransferase involved in cell wall biosynthesis
MKLVIQNGSAVWGGNEKWLSIVARGLQARGHDIVVSCVAGAVSKKLEGFGVRTTHHRPRGAIDLVSALDFAAFLKREKPDALLITSWRSTTWSVIGARIAGVERIVMRLGIVRAFPESGPREWALRHVDALIVNSDEIRARWLETKPAEVHNDVHVVMNAIAAPTEDRQAMRHALRAELQVDDDAIVVGGAGHLAARKGFDVLIHAFNAASISGSMLVIIGDGEYRRELEAIAHKTGNSRIRFLGHRDNASELIGGLDVFVLSSSNEGMANVMLEAMAAGVPVIAGEISGVTKAIGTAERPTPGGWTFQRGGVEELAVLLSNVSTLIQSRSPELARRTAEAQWRMANWFGTSRMIEECERILFPE